MKFNMLVGKSGTMFHTLQLSSGAATHLGCCACNIFFLMSIKVLPSFTCTNADLSNRLLEMRIQLLDDLWLPWGLLSRCTLVCITACPDELRGSLCLGVPEHHGQRLSDPGNIDPSLKEEMTPYIIFQSWNLLVFIFLATNLPEWMPFSWTSASPAHLD